MYVRYIPSSNLAFSWLCGNYGVIYEVFYEAMTSLNGALLRLENH